MFSCAKCGKNFSYVYLYLGHVRNFHRHDSNFNYICGLNDCPLTFKTFSEFKKHLCGHEDKAKNMKRKLFCKTCKFQSYSKSKFISHYRNHNIIACPLNSCQLTYSVYSSFTSHLSRHHPCYTINDFKSDILSSVGTNSSNTFQLLNADAVPSLNSNDSETILENSVQMSQYDKNVVLFILKMQEKFLLPDSTINEMINEVNELQNDTVSLVTFFHIRGFKLESSKGVTILDLQNFVDVYPLSIYNYKGCMVVIQKYLLFNPEE